jgi:hypothetical protein
MSGAVATNGLFSVSITRVGANVGGPLSDWDLSGFVVIFRHGELLVLELRERSLGALKHCRVNGKKLAKGCCPRIRLAMKQSVVLEIEGQPQRLQLTFSGWSVKIVQAA